MSLLWIFGWLLAQRLFEIVVSRRHRRDLLARGGREFFPASFQRIALMHGLFTAALAVESFPWTISLDLLSYGCLAVLAGLQAGRWWCMAALGEHWNVRIIVVPGEGCKRSGPYRWLRHPNYLLVTLEFVFLPLLMRALITLIVFSIANLVLLRQRIRLEEMALAPEAAGRAMVGGGVTSNQAAELARAPVGSAEVPSQESRRPTSPEPVASRAKANAWSRSISM